MFKISHSKCLPWGVAAAVAGAAVSAKGASKAAKSQKEASDSANQTQLEMYYQNRDDQENYRKGGGSALNNLLYLAGIGGAREGAIDSDPLLTENLVDNDGAVPRPNMLLYETNEAYRNAWDSEVARHRSNFGTGYVDSSDAGEIEKDLRNILAPEFMAARKKQEEQKAADRTSGNGYGSLLRDFAADDLTNDPIYQERLRVGLPEGNEAIERSAVSRGGLYSGNTLKGLTRFNQDFASNEGMNSFNRFNVNRGNKVGLLSQIAGMGQGATNQTGSYGMQTAQTVGNNQLQAGNARAAGYVGAGNAINSGIGQGLNWYNQNNTLNSLKQQPTSNYVGDDYRWGGLS